MADSDYRVTLYTYHGCPYAHRAHIALKELGLPFEEVIIDLDKPREPWYLQVNPVPSLCPLRIVTSSELIACDSAVSSQP
jgi:glutathione S-transferase